MTAAMNVEKREASTKSVLRRLRSNGKVPGVVYGKDLAQTALIAVDQKELMSMLRTNPRGVILMDVPGAGRQHVMINEMQRDALTSKLIHIDFRQVNMQENVKTSVRLEAEGESAGVKEGGIYQVLLHELEIRCLPDAIPSLIVFDVSAMQIGDTLLVSDLPIPEGIEVLSKPDEVVATILAPQKDISEDEAEDAAVEEAEAKSRKEEAQAEETNKV